MLLIPLFELAILLFSAPSASDLEQRPSIFYYVIVLVKAMIRLYFAYLIFSYFMRLDRGEALLVEYGEKRLGKMIDKIRDE